jgi:hypothetical protein
MGSLQRFRRHGRGAQCGAARIENHSTSRRYVLNGGLDEETREAFRDLLL